MLSKSGGPLKNIIIVCLSVAIVSLLSLYLSAPDVQKLRGCITTKMYKVWLCDQSPNFAPYDQISSHIIGAVIVSEDASFFSHEGLDFEEIRESFITNLIKGRFARGGSTITQQLAKNVFLSSEKSIFRKLEEVYLAFQIEKLLTKKRILNLYLNVVEFGPGIFGIKQACAYYFNKDTQSLYPEEAAFLAFLLPNPKKYSQSFVKKQMTPFADSSVKRILHKMYLSKKISDSEYIIARGRASTLFGGTAESIEDAPPGSEEEERDFKYESELESI